MKKSSEECTGGLIWADVVLAEGLVLSSAPSSRPSIDYHSQGVITLDLEAFNNDRSVNGTVSFLAEDASVNFSFSRDGAGERRC